MLLSIGERDEAAFCIARLEFMNSTYCLLAFNSLSTAEALPTANLELAFFLIEVAPFERVLPLSIELPHKWFEAGH